MPRRASLVLVTIFVALGLWWLASAKDPALPTPPPPAAAATAADTAGTAAASLAATAAADPIVDSPERRSALPAPTPDEPVSTVTGVVLADRRAPDLSAVRIFAYRGEASDQNGALMTGMAGSGGISRQPAFVLTGEPVASTTVDRGGLFTLRTAERHLRLALEHDLYVLPMPEIVHVPAALRTAEVVLAPLLGGCVHGRLLGERRAEVSQVKLLLDGDPMSAMRDSRLFVGAMLGSRRTPEVPDHDGRFVFRGVLPASAITLFAEGPQVVGRATQPPLEPGETREVVLAVQAAASLAITVVTNRATPIAAADVTVRSTLVVGMTVPQLSARRGSTIADGTCRIDGLLAERVRVEVLARGYTAASTFVDLQVSNEPQQLRITLDEGGVVQGVVQDPDGKPLAMAHVAHHPSTDVPLLGDLATQLGPDHLANVAAEGAATDAEGRFRLTGIADDGEFLVVAAHPDYAAGIARGVRLGAADVVITLQTLGALAGQIVAADGEQPLASFTVTLLRTAFLVMRTPVRQQIFENAAGGAFRLAGIPPGSYTLQVAAEGRSDAQQDVVIKTGELDVGTLKLSPAATIQGTVRDEQGQPIAHAQVRRRQGAMADNPMMAMFGGGSLQAHTDAQGRFRLTPLAPGRVQLLASAEGFASGRSERLQLAAGQELSDVVLTLGHGGTIHGHLLVGPGQQVDEFQLLAQEQGTQATHAGELAPDGTFTIGNLDPGQYTVQAMPGNLMRGFGNQDWKPGQSMRFGEMFQKITDQVVSQRCAVRAGETTEVELDASEVSVGIQWTLRVEIGGRPLDSGIVEASALADGRVRVAMLHDGTATFGGMRPGAHRVQVRAGMTMVPIGQPQDVDLPTRTDAHRSTLALPGGQLHGRVVDATSGEPLRAALVRLLHDGNSENDDPLGMALTDATGAFHFSGLADGNYSLVAVDGLLAQRDSTASRRSGIQVAAATATEPIELRAAPAASASVLVATTGGNPIAGATVLCVDAEGHPLGAMGLSTSGPDGRAWFGGLPRGAVRVVGRAPGYAPAATEVQEIGADHAVEFQLQLPTGVRTVLQTFDRAGQALAGATLTARCNGGPWLPSMLLIEGRRGDGGFELGRLCRGAWEFRVTHPSIGTLVQARAIGDESSVTVVMAPR